MLPLVKQLVLASHNAKKTLELRQVLEPLGIELLNLSDFPGAPEPEENGETFAANAIIKAESARAYTGMAAAADDSGLAVEALSGAPGIHSARYSGEKTDDTANNRLLLHNLLSVPAERRQAKFISVIALAVPGMPIQTSFGETHGSILFEGRGKGGFGYDPLFLSNDLGKTFAEASECEKNRVSHRARAVQSMIRYLKNQP